MSMKEIKLSKNKGIVFIDDEDYDRVSQHKWGLSGGYPSTHIYRGHYISVNNGHYKYKRKLITISRFIMNSPKGKVVDHKDHNLLNNQKSNLRVCEQKQNTQNVLPRKGNKSSKYKGVHWDKGSNCWRACINHKHIGRFKIENEAVLAYNEKSKILFGEYGLLNVIT